MGVLWVCYGYPMVSIGSSSYAPIYNSRDIRCICFFVCGCKDTKNIWDVQILEAKKCKKENPRRGGAPRIDERWT